MRFSGRWHLQRTLARRREHHCSTVVISAVDSASPSTIYGWTSFLSWPHRTFFWGNTDSQNVLVIADREYGPSKASPSGTVAFDALVHPKVRQGTLRSTLRDGRTLDVPAPLPLTEYPRVSFMPQPRSMPVGASHTVLLVATTPDGAPLNNATITVRSNASTLGQAALTQTAGVYALPVTPEQVGTTPLEAQMKDPAALIGKQQRASSALTVIPRAPHVTLTADPNEFETEREQIVLTATVVHSDGQSTAGPPTFASTGSRMRTRPASKGGGSFQMKVTPTAGTMSSAVLPRMQGSAGTPAAVMIWPASPDVLPGESLPVLVAAVDAFGHPVPDVEFKLTAPGGGTFAAETKSGPNGLASATYTASSNPGLFTLRAEAAGLSMDTAIFHGDAQAGPGPSSAGTAETVALRASLTPLVGTVRVDKKEPPPPPPVAVAPPVVVAPAAAAPPPVAQAPAPTPPTTPPPAAPAAVVPSPAPTPSSATSAAPRTAGMGLAGSTTEVYVALVGSHHRFTQTADVEEGVASPLPPTAEFNRGMAPGVRLGGDYWLNDGPLAITADTRLTMEKITAGGRVISYTAWSFQVGAKYKLEEMGFGQPYVIGTLQRAHNSLFKFRDESMTTMRATHQSLIGARIGAGVLTSPAPGLTLDVHLSELLNPMPAMTHFGAIASKEVATDIRAMAGLELYHKHVALTSSGVDVDISDLDIGVVAGVAYVGL